MTLSNPTSYRHNSSFLITPNTTLATMPPIRTSRNQKPPPDGFDDLEDTLLEFANKMKDGKLISLHSGSCLCSLGFCLRPCSSPRLSRSRPVRRRISKLMRNYHVTTAGNAPHEGKRKNEATWEIFKISHQRELPPPTPQFFLQQEHTS